MRAQIWLILATPLALGCGGSGKETTTGDDTGAFVAPNGAHSWAGTMRSCTTEGIEFDLWTNPTGGSRLELDIYSHADGWTETHEMPLEGTNAEFDRDHWMVTLQYGADPTDYEPGVTTAADCNGGFDAHFAIMFSVFDAGGALTLCHIDGDDLSPFEGLECHEGWE